MRARNALVKVVLGVLGLGLGLILTEATLRVLDPPIEVHNPLHGFHVGDPWLGWRGKPNVKLRFHQAEFDVLVESTAEGFRRPDPEPPGDAALRLLFLGDSFTWGWGVPQGHVFTDWLQRAVAPALAIDNRGVNAYGTAQEYLLLRQELERRRYARVAVVFYANDVRDNVDRKPHRPYFEIVDGALVARNLPAPAELQSAFDTFVEEHSRAYLFFNHRLALLKRLLPGGESEEADDPTPVDASGHADYTALPGYPVTARLLIEMRELCRKHGAELYLVYVPSRSELASQPSHEAFARAVHEMIEVVARDQALPLIDLTPRFYAGTRQGAELVYRHDEHWNMAGHRLAAEVLLASPLFAGLR